MEHHLPAVDAMDVAGADQGRVRLAILSRRTGFVGQHDDITARLHDALELDLEIAPAIGIFGGFGKFRVAHRLCHLRERDKAFRVGIGTQTGTGFEGQLDQLAFYKRAISTTDEADWYNSGAGRTYASL